MRDICEEAKMSPGHLYHYFDDKEAIIEGIGEMVLKAAAAHMKTILESQNPLETLFSEFERSRDRNERSRLNLLLDLMLEAGRNSKLAAVLQLNSNRIRVLVARFVEQGQTQGQFDTKLDPDEAADILIGIVDGARLATIRNPAADTNLRIEYLRRLVVRFLSPTQSG